MSNVRGVLNEKHFYGKDHAENVYQKLFPDHFLILLYNLKQPFHEILLKISYFERGLTLFFLSNSVAFNGQSYQKQKGSGTRDQVLFRLRNKFQNKLFIGYILSDQV